MESRRFISASWKSPSIAWRPPNEMNDAPVPGASDHAPGVCIRWVSVSQSARPRCDVGISSTSTSFLCIGNRVGGMARLGLN